MNSKMVSALVFAIAMGSAPWANSAEVRKIVPMGTDGDAHFYEVLCSNNESASFIVHEGKPPRVCAQPQLGEEKCENSWSQNNAAAYACK